MSVYIDMDMPTSCSTCKLFGEYGCPFVGAVGYALTRGERCEDCPLIPVPDHGDLIERDALIEAMARMVPWAITDPTANAFLDGLSAAYEAIKAAPTIIPADHFADATKMVADKEWPEWRSQVLGQPYTADKEGEG